MIDIISFLDIEIANLQEARALLTDTSNVAVAVRRPGRPKGSKNAPKVVETQIKGKRTMSPAGRARIITAQKARWAHQKG